jgi:hypothetical protein
MGGAMKLRSIAGLALLGLLFALPVRSAEMDWRGKLQQAVHVFGHRNWIVVVDSAYPLQNAPGIQVVAADADQTEVVRQVLTAVRAARHVRPKVYVDAELAFVPEADAKGIGAYRDRLKEILGNQEAPVPHEQLIRRLQDASAGFQVLILKTNLTLPYTSVFLELECGYWTDAAEARLRRAMAGAPVKPSGS